MKRNNSDPETNSLLCSKPGGSYCASGSLEGPTIITCASQHTVEISSCNIFLKDLLPEGYEEKATCYETTSWAGDALCAFNGTGYALIKKSRDVVPVSVPETVLCGDDDENDPQTWDDSNDEEDAFVSYVDDEDDDAEDIFDPYVEDEGDDAEDTFIPYVDDEDNYEDNDEDDEKEGEGRLLFAPKEDTSAGPTLPYPPLLPATHPRKTASTSGPSSTLSTLSTLLSMTSSPSSATETAAMQEVKRNIRERACSDPWKIPSSSFSIQDMGFSTISSTSTMDSTTAGSGHRQPLSTFTSTIYASRSAGVAANTVTITTTESGTPTSAGVWDDNPEKESTPVKTSDASHTSESGSEMHALEDRIIFQDLAILWVLWVVLAYIFG
ncbi:acidic leucine-rich nuclear phosphoprotein 32 member [Aspergillus niger]|uniref:Acidic leucine-rich nuclear phosphoprotein 32 member n=1 Tax=Aspergillus niger TaxID=5061 RepID=A0A9W5ZVK1_ASPNG|nr:acidic leucine-rich nuclear phosphoprotein 32 member [Aspergillus niger]GLA47073.1 acidic leucine-rich nuclear phosphoprotein 32 member [Aspergillus niger]